jgi:hypothetical protein
MAPDLRSLEEIRRKVIRDLVDLDIVSARRLGRRRRILRAVRRRLRR